MDWLETYSGRTRRERCAPFDVPQQAPLLNAEELALLRQWVRSDNAKRGYESLMKEAGASGIELAEALVFKLLNAGWLVCRERLKSGKWQWESIVWRDLTALQRFMGVAGPRQRADERQSLLHDARDWLAEISDRVEGALDPDLLDEFAQALEQLGQATALPPERLRVRVQLFKALAQWDSEGSHGPRRNFALHASGTTKGIAAADWRWLESAFDLERLRITSFAPILWMAGDVALLWGERRADLASLHCAGLPIADVMPADRIDWPQPRRFWLIENRTSFERQARERAPGQFLLWLPGRPFTAWLEALEHVLTLAPAPAWISADADPAGVDIACAVGTYWTARGLVWKPHLMGAAQLQRSTVWPLNAHDHALLTRLLQRSELDEELRELCVAMQREGRKAEQEGWL